jgi:hypothetical protein
MTDPTDPTPKPRRPATDPAQVLSGILALVVIVVVILLIATLVIWWWRNVVG